MNEATYIQIEAYLAGSMNSEEAQAFEEKIASNPDLAREVNLYDAINQHLHEQSWKSIPKSNKSDDQNALTQYFESKEARNLEKTLREVGQVYDSKKANTTKKISFLPYAAAIAVLIIASVAFLLLKPNSYDTLYSEYYTSKDLPSLVSRGKDTNQDLSNGITAFKQKKYQKAIVFLIRYTEKTDQPNPLVYSYIGMSYLESGAVDKAIVAFDQLLNTDSIDKSKALWYKSLAYLKTQQKEKLQKTLTIIISDANNYNYPKAKKLLDEL